MSGTRIAPKQRQSTHQARSAQRPSRVRPTPAPDRFAANGLTTDRLLAGALQAEHGIPKSDASHLFRRVAATSSRPLGKVRAELIPDSTWKRSGKTLGPQASQTTARLSHVLELAERVWGNEKDATEWLNSPHPELEGATPFSLLKTEAGGRAVAALLAALEFGFPV